MIEQIRIDPALLLLKVLAGLRALLALQDADTIRSLDLLVADVAYGGRQVSKLVGGAGEGSIVDGPWGDRGHTLKIGCYQGNIE